MTDEQKKKLEQKLWDIANTLRGKMNADEFRDYILGFIFYKYLSERLQIYANSVLVADGIKFSQIDETTEDGKAYLEAVADAAISALGYFLKPSELFSAVAKRGSKPGNFILEDLARILNNIERSTMGTESEDDFDDLFSDMDLTSNKLGRTEEAKNTLIAKVLTHLDEIDFELEKADSDVLGDAYEYLIGQFASGAGKKAGEFYTPQEVSTILAKIVTTGKSRIKNVYDPACGSGSLLLRVAKEVEVGDFNGQEMNRTTYNLARMNMILHGVHYRNFDLKQEDTLEHPQHAEKRFEAVVANPPFSAKWSSNPLLLNDDRYAQYGRLAPSSKADFAFVQHMLHQLDENGTMAVILPHGVLFRGAAEGHIREYIIKERNWLDAVIGLPANIFYGTSIPTCILVFKKCREHPDDILFVDASTCFEKAKNQNMLRPQDIEKIVNTYQNRAVEKRFSHRAKLSEVAENDYNLNIPRYVDTFEAEEPIDLAEVVQNMELPNEVSKLADEVVKKFCAELKIHPPIGSNLQTLERYKRGLMQALFSQTLRFTKPDGSTFPDWEEKRLGDIATKNDSGIYKNRDLYGSGHNIVGVSDLFSMNAIDGQTFRNVPLDDVEIAKNTLEEGDILYAESSLVRAGIAKAVYVTARGAGTAFAWHTRRFSVDSQVANSAFIFYYLESEIARRYIEAVATQTALTGITTRDYFKTPVFLPHPDEQAKIAGALSAMDAKIAAVGDQVARMEAFKKGLLQQMFV